MILSLITYPKSVMLYLSTSSGTRSSSSRDDTDLSCLNGSDSDNTSVDTAGDAVDLLDEELWKSVLVICRGFADISLRRSIDNVSDSETLNSLILGDATTTVATADGLDMTATVLGSSVISAFYGHKKLKLR